MAKKNEPAAEPQKENRTTTPAIIRLEGTRWVTPDGHKFNTPTKAWKHLQTIKKKQE